MAAPPATSPASSPEMPPSSSSSLPPPPSPATPNPSSALLDLPAEIRNAIYFYALALNTPIRARDLKDSFEPPLTRVNKQLREETVQIFWTANTFEASQDYLLHVLELLPVHKLKMIQSAICATSTKYTFHDACHRLVPRVMALFQRGLKRDALRVRFFAEPEGRVVCKVEKLEDFEQEHAMQSVKRKADFFT